MFILLNLSISYADERQVILIEENTENPVAVVMNESVVERYLGEDYGLEVDFSSAIFFNRVGLRIKRKFFDGAVDVGLDTGAHVALVGDGGFDLDVGGSASIMLAKHKNNRIYIQGGAYRVLGLSMKGLDQKSKFNLLKLGVGYKNTKSGTTHGFAIQAYKMSKDNTQTDKDYIYVPMYNLRQEFDLR